MKMMFPRISHLIGEQRSTQCKRTLHVPATTTNVSPKHIIFGCFLRKGTLKSKKNRLRRDQILSNQ